MLRDKIHRLISGGVADNIFDWRSFRDIFAQMPASEDEGRQPHVLLAMSLYEEQFTNMYALLTAALRLRGARVSILMDDGVLPASEKSIFWHGRHYIGRRPFDIYPVKKIFHPFSVRIFRYSEFVHRSDRRAIREHVADIDLSILQQYRPEGLAIGEHALAGALRYFAKGTLDDEPHADAVVRQYVEAAELTALVMKRLLAEYQIDAGCFHHGIYVPQGIIGEVLRQHNVRVVNWNVAYRERCFIFSHGDTYHHTLLNEPTTSWENVPFTPEIDKKITEYLVSRHRGSKDWISFNRSPEEDKQKIIQQLHIDTAKPIIALLTNVIWDAQLHYRTNIFPNMIVWVNATIAYMCKRPDLQLVIRIHPAEQKGTIVSRQPILTEIQRTYPQLPPNVFVIPPESSISTYAIGELCNATIIYGTKTGVELVSNGIPTIVAGEAWIKNKGLTIDPKTEEEYYALLDTLPFAQRLDAATIQRAKRYAYHFFYRRMIPVQTIQSTQSIYFKLNIERIEQLQSGADPGLDTICDGILMNSPFIYRDEAFSTQITNTTNKNYSLDLR